VAVSPPAGDLADWGSRSAFQSFSTPLATVTAAAAAMRAAAARSTVFQARDLKALAKFDTLAWQEHTPDDGAKCTPALLTGLIFETYQALIASAQCETLVD
jgi:hypothetical protein